MKVDRIILNSNDNEIATEIDLARSTLVNNLLNTLTSGQITSSKYYSTNISSRIIHNLDGRVLEKPKKVRIAKVAMNASIPSFNKEVNGLKMFKRHWQHNVNNPVQNSSFEIVMDDRKIYNTFAEFNTEFNSKLSAIDPGFTSTIDNETGKLTINNASTAFQPMVVDTRVEVLRKFGFLWPTFLWSALGLPVTSFQSQKAVELAQSSKILIRGNLEPNTYCSNGERLLGFIPYTLDIKDVNSGDFCSV